MTYRQKIEELIKTINSVYDDAEWLRDIASEPEKKHWNDIRRIFYDAADPLRKLDRSLSPDRANIPV